MQGEESRVRIVPGPAARFAATARRLVQPAGDSRLAPCPFRAAIAPQPDHVPPRSRLVSWPATDPRAGATARAKPGFRPPASPGPPQPGRRADERGSPLSRSPPSGHRIAARPAPHAVLGRQGQAQDHGEAAEMPRLSPGPRRQPPGPPAGRPARLVPRTLRAPAHYTLRPAHMLAAFQAQRSGRFPQQRRRQARTATARQPPLRPALPRQAERLPFFIFLRRLSTSLVPRSSARTPQPYNLRNTECPRPVQSRLRLQPRTATMLRCLPTLRLAGCSAALSVLLDIIRNKKGLPPLRYSDCALRACRAAALRKRLAALSLFHPHRKRQAGTRGRDDRGLKRRHDDGMPSSLAAGRYGRSAGHSVPQVDTGASPRLSVGKLLTWMPKRRVWDTDLQPARSRQQTHLRCRPWFKYATISALLGDSKPKTPCSLQRLTRPPQPASGGPPRLVPRTFRATQASPLTTGPGARRRHAGAGRLAHRPCRHPPLRYQSGPGQKNFLAAAHMPAAVVANAVKCAQMPSNLYLRPLPDPPPGCMRRASGRAGKAGGLLFGGRDGTAA